MTVTVRPGYLPYTTATALDIVTVDDPPTRVALAGEAARQRRQELAEYRQAHNDRHATVLEARPHEFADQELAELLDLEARSRRDSRPRTKTTVQVRREHTIDELTILAAGWSRR
jgi:hypothetical protein